MTVTRRVQAALRQAGVSETVATTAQVAPIVSPMCRASDWTCVRVLTDDDAWFIKLRERDAADFVTVLDAAAGAQAAAAKGVGPALRFAHPHSGAMGFELLPSPWREARLSDVANPSILTIIIESKRSLHSSSVQLRRWDVFEQIDFMARETFDPPNDLQVLMQAVMDIRLALQAGGQDIVPGHADGVASNIMINPAGDVRLVDFDCAGLTDIHYDFGVLLNEACHLDHEWEAGVELAFGSARQQDLNRCRLYGIADDLLWGLWGLSRHVVSTRSDLEFFKYACWRLLRCRIGLHSAKHADRLSHL